MTQYEFLGGSDQSFRSGRPQSAWDIQREHRQIITSMLARSAESGAKSLCVFGSGPCHDVDLNTLSRLFPEVTLVDIDEAALKSGYESQCDSEVKNIQLAGGVDLFGGSELLREYEQKHEESLIDRVIERVLNYHPDSLSTYDCVASTCMLSQLLNEASEAIDHSHNRFVDVLKAIRLRHLQIMCSVLNPGGQGFLITDVVSSESLPDLDAAKDLKELLRKAIVNQNFLHGLNPPMVAKVFQDESLSSQISSVRVSDPWRWKVPDRTYACFTIAFTKKR